MFLDIRASFHADRTFNGQDLKVGQLDPSSQSDRNSVENLCIYRTHICQMRAVMHT